MVETNTKGRNEMTTYKFKLEQHEISFPGLSPYKAVVRQTENGETTVREIGIPSSLASGRVHYELSGVGIDKDTGDVWVRGYSIKYCGGSSRRRFAYLNMNDETGRVRSGQPMVECMETVTNHKGETFQVPACKAKIRFTTLKCPCGCGRAIHIDH
jgi:hypothetical protein